MYSYNEGTPDPELTRFSIEHDRVHILPILREARKANPDLFLFSSPWSPPGWMKSNGLMPPVHALLRQLFCEVLAVLRD
jgi:glucosylceramidase